MNVVTVAPQSVAVRANNSGAGRIVTGYAVRVDGRTVRIYDYPEYDNFGAAMELAERIKLRRRTARVKVADVEPQARVAE